MLDFGIENAKIYTNFEIEYLKWNKNNDANHMHQQPSDRFQLLNKVNLVLFTLTWTRKCSPWRAQPLHFLLPIYPLARICISVLTLVYLTCSCLSCLLPKKYLTLFLTCSECSCYYTRSNYVILKSLLTRKATHVISYTPYTFPSLLTCRIIPLLLRWRRGQKLR